MTAETSSADSTWIFGYGSLIWRPGFPYIERRRARLHGWQRRFWQGSHDHRGLPERPGRVVTLAACDDGWCDGMAYRVDAQTLLRTFEVLDHREKNGYQRLDVTLEMASGNTPAVVYVATTDNHAYLGPAPIADMARQIVRCAGPSGANLDYLLDLARALRDLGTHDAHVFELEAAALQQGAATCM